MRPGNRLRLAIVAVAAAGLLTASEPARCQEKNCGNVRCNEQLPCPGASCGCVKRPGQPFGRCAPY